MFVGRENLSVAGENLLKGKLRDIRFVFQVD
jgi:hypothetical protein